MKMVAVPYVQLTLRDTVVRIMECKHSCEVRISIHIPSRQIDVESTSTSIQRRGRRRNDVDFRSKTQIESTLIYRRRNDVDKMTSKRRRFQVENANRIDVDASK